MNNFFSKLIKYRFCIGFKINSCMNHMASFGITCCPNNKFLHLFGLFEYGFLAVFINIFMQVIDYIYALCETDSREMFYIGRTIDPKRRIGEHRLGSRNYKLGDENKYAYANALDELGIEWEMIVLMECGLDTEFYEDFFINKHRSEPLQNMRAGDTEPWMGRDYLNPEEFLKSKKEHLNQIRVKQPKIQRETICDPDRMIFSFENPNKKFESPAIKWLRARSRGLKI